MNVLDRVFQRLKDPWPVGSIHVSVSPDNPATTIGYGVWQEIGSGRVLVGVDPGDADFRHAKRTAGAKTVTLVANNLPAAIPVTITDPGHTHTQRIVNTTTAGASGSQGANVVNNANGSGSDVSATTGITAQANVGSPNTAVSLVQPSLAVYFWERVG